MRARADNRDSARNNVRPDPGQPDGTDLGSQAECFLAGVDDIQRIQFDIAEGRVRRGGHGRCDSALRLISNPHLWFPETTIKSDQRLRA